MRVVYTPGKLKDILSITVSKLSHFTQYDFSVEYVSAIDPQDSQFPRLDYSSLEFPQLRVQKDGSDIFFVQLQDSSQHRLPIAIFVYKHKIPGDLFKAIVHELKSYRIECFERNI